MTVLLRFRDLKARGIVNSWPQLRNLQDKYGFRVGFLLGPNQRAWREDDIDAWLQSRPTDRVAPRGIAKRRHEERKRAVSAGRGARNVAGAA